MPAAALVTTGDPDLASSERCLPPVTLRSVQLYKSQDEYIVVMKEDLAEWMNELFNTSMTADDLFETIETGVLLCRYACTVNDAIRSRGDVRCEEPGPVKYRKRGVEAGSFQARVNVAEFLTWCRGAPLRMPDDVLFETGDLICQPGAERNERQIALSLLEVGRRSAALRLGLPAPQLVRLEAEIDAEIRADDNSNNSALMMTGDIDNRDNSVMMMTTVDSNTEDINDDDLVDDDVDDDVEDEEEEEDDDEVLVIVEESASSLQQPPAVSTPRPKKTRSIRPPSVIVTRRHSNQEAETVCPAAETSSLPTAEKRGSMWQRRRYRPIIPVDMMTLDEMARHIDFLSYAAVLISRLTTGFVCLHVCLSVSVRHVTQGLLSSNSKT